MKATSLDGSTSKIRPALRLVSTKELPREDWLQIRKQGISSSDAAAAVGLNPYKSQLEMWLEKTGRDAGMPKADPHDEESPMYWGNILEPIVAWHYSKRTKQRVRRLIGDDDPLGTFVFRTTGFNSIRTLAARLHYLQAISGNRLACLPLELRLRGKPTRQSHGTPIFYVDLTVRGGIDMAEALRAAKELDAQRQAAGFIQAALDEAAQRGFGNGSFEDSEEDVGAIVAEFYPAEDSQSPTANSPLQSAKSSLAEKLEAQAQRHTPPVDNHQGADHAPAQTESQ